MSLRTIPFAVVLRLCALCLCALYLSTGCASRPPEHPLAPTVVTDPVPHDSDDPAFWIHPTDPTRSLLLGTDKMESSGGLYVFDLTGAEQTALRRDALDRPNNVDVAYGVPLGADTIDVAIVTERGRQRLRIFRLPDMTPVDGGGLPVFTDQPDHALVMGVAVYQPPGTGETFVIVSRKTAPRPSGYLYQYRLHEVEGMNRLGLSFARAFGSFEGSTEIEAVAVDPVLGYVYYADEGFGIRKYYAHPDSGQAELAVFGTDHFVGDREGIALYATSDSTGYLLVSDQQGGELHVYPREGIPGQPHTHPLLAEIPWMARDTDGVDATAHPLGPTFPRGAVAAMSTDRTFHLYDWRAIEARLP